MSNHKDSREEVIHTREMPVVSFCVYCDKPIYIGEKYKEVEYYGNSKAKKLRKKDLNRGYAHVHCIEEREAQVEQLKESSQKKTSLVIGIITGAVVAIALMIIFLVTKAMIVGLSIVIPLLIGYLITSSIYALFSSNVLERFYKKIALKMALLPKWIIKSKLHVVIKVLMFIFVVPLDFVALIIISLLSMIISMFLFPILLINLKK